MEYQTKKKQILQQVQYTNLLGFTLVQNRLQRNFRSIVDALMLNQNDTQSIKQQLKKMEGNDHHAISKLADRIKLIQQQLSNNDNSNNIVRPSTQSSNASKKRNISIDSQHQQNNNLQQQKQQLPKLKINYISSQRELEDCIQQSDLIKKLRQHQNTNDDRYDQLKNLLNSLRHDLMQNTSLIRDLQGLKEQVTALKAQIKTVSQRTQKSIRRVSLQATPLAQLKQINQTQRDLTQKPKTTNSIKLQDQLDKQINNLHLEMNTLKIVIQEIKQNNNQSKRKDNKNMLNIQDLQLKLKKLTEKENQDVEDLYAKIKEIKMEQIGNVKDVTERDITENNSNNNSSNKENNKGIAPTNKQLLNLSEKVNKIQGALHQFCTSTELTRLKNSLEQKINNLQAEDQSIRKQLKDQIQILQEVNDQKNQQLKIIQSQLQQNKQEIKENNNQLERKNNITNSKIQEIKKNLQNLKEDLEFYKSMNQDMKNTQPMNNMMNTNTNNNGFMEDSSDKKNNTKANQNLKKYFNRKLHDQRAYLLGLIRDLQKKSGHKTGVEQDLVNIWDKIAEINLFLTKKANEDDVKKHLGYLDKKISTIYTRISNTQENNDDARIARTNWVCLSCDKNLHSYQGKVGKHIVWDSMPAKTGFPKNYVTKQEEKKSLPTLKR